MSSQCPPSKKSGLNNIMSYCLYNAQVKTLDQKGTKRFNTATNTTQSSQAMQASQKIRNGRFYSVYNATLTASIQSKTATQITLAMSGIYYYINIVRNGVTIQPFLRIPSPGTYLDSMDIMPNTLYRYEITPYSTANVPGNTTIIQTYTDSTVSAESDFLTFNSIKLLFTGSYNYLDIKRDDTIIADNFTGSSYDDVALQYNTTYNYQILSYNTIGSLGNTTNLSIVTYSNVYIINTTVTNTSVTFNFGGAYSNLVIYRNSVPLMTDLSGTTYTDSTVLANTNYLYTIESYNSIGLLGVVNYENIYTLSSLQLGSVSTTSTTVALSFTGRYKDLTVNRDGIDISTNVNGNTLLDIDLSANTMYTYLVKSYNNIGNPGGNVILSAMTSS